MAKRKSIVLVILVIVIVVLSIITGAYFSYLISEKKSVDTERLILQALNLAEAGVNHTIVELKKGVPRVLKENIEKSSPQHVKADLERYNSSQTPLSLLEDYANFTIKTIGNITIAEFKVLGSNLSSGIKGSYIANITVINPTNTTNESNPKCFKPDNCIFYYKYTINSTATMEELPIKKSIGLLNGNFTVRVYKKNYAEYALFTNHQRTPSGTIVWFTANTNFTGPLHTNDRFNFANNPSGTFTDTVTQHLTTARFYNQGLPKLLDADSNPPYDVPNFQEGFSRGAGLINLPSSITQQDLVRQATGNRPLGSFSKDGIYLPNNNNTLDGGIYIRGDVRNLTMGVDENNRPIYTITQGNNTKQIIIDYANNQTIVTDISGSGGTSAGNYSGIPNGITDEGIIIYGNGKIGNFSGIVQSDTKITVSSDSDISINNHITYQSYNSGPPLNAIGYNNTLGILTWNGNVRISTSAPNDLNIHGIVMAAGRNSIFTVDNYNVPPPRGTVTLLGGVITDFYGPFGTFSGNNQISGYGRNFIYDSRMREGLFPPYFPYLGNFTASLEVEDEKLIWQDKGV
ncbi:MAG: DUF4900 domain-containing protein [Candidatus Omnitrophica bacterium]|nr:DUF4900 domain-containing protein [Candidatus Omnitrophota bacterium]MCM8832056.1 DUF4900 domain-containing protein [Candidatus Omnitrophota bacterium]